MSISNFLQAFLRAATMSQGQIRSIPNIRILIFGPQFHSEAALCHSILQCYYFVNRNRLKFKTNDADNTENLQ